MLGPPLALVIISGALLSATAQASEVEAHTAVQEGLRLHDAGRFEEALAAYRRALELDPTNVGAEYEIAFSLMALERYEECVEAAKRVLPRSGQLKAQVYTVLGNCHDLAGDPKQARRIYRKALKEFPQDARLAFNAAVTEGLQGEWKDARRLLEQAVEADPSYLSAHRALAVTFARGGYKVQAVLAWLRFLSLEPEGARAHDAAEQVLALLGAGFEQTGPSEFSIGLSMDLPKDEGDYGAAELVRAMGGAVVETEEWQGRSAGAKLLHRLDNMLAAVDEGPGARSRDFARTHYMPFVRALREANLMEAFVYQVFAPIGPPELAAWLAEHPEEQRRLSAFLGEAAN